MRFGYGGAGALVAMIVAAWMAPREYAWMVVAATGVILFARELYVMHRFISKK